MNEQYPKENFYRENDVKNRLKELQAEGKIDLKDFNLDQFHGYYRVPSFILVGEVKTVAGTGVCMIVVDK